MNIFKLKIPSYLYEKKNLVKLILLTAAFALGFINLYKPFSSENWYNVSQTKFFLYSSLLILTGVLVVGVSRITMYYRTRKHTLSYAIYGLWVLMEIFVMSIIYTIYTLKLNPGRNLSLAFQTSITNTSLVLLLPYSALWLYFSWQDTLRKLELLEEVVSQSNKAGSILNFYDEKGELRFSVKKDGLLYIESADNYILIWYYNKGSVSKYMLRNSLKNMEVMLKDTNIMRCHRSYMVNLDQVKVIRREKNGVYLQMDVDSVPDIPISRSYSEKAMEWFSQFSA